MQNIVSQPYKKYKVNTTISQIFTCAWNEGFGLCTKNMCEKLHLDTQNKIHTEIGTDKVQPLRSIKYDLKLI